jgi:hypothetical protein
MTLRISRLKYPQALIKHREWMMKKILAAALAIVALAGCGSMVRQADLDTWPGMPVEALDTHSLFLTMRLNKTMTDSGIEVRNYSDADDSVSCTNSPPNKTLKLPTFTNCSSGGAVCSNIFYIKDKIVLEYIPVGICGTNAKSRPQQRYLELGKQ